MQIKDAVGVITGAAGGIGRAVALELARRQVGTLALVDQSNAVKQVAREVDQMAGHSVARIYTGDVTDEGFRAQVYQELYEAYGQVHICVPAAGITRDALAVKIDKQKDKVVLYPLNSFRLVVEVNLIAPVYWGLELIAGVAGQRKRLGLGRWQPEEPVQGTIVFIGSVSSLGNKGQVSYAATKAGLDGAAATLMAEGIYHGVRCLVVHPGFTDTPMVRALGQELIQEQILPQTQLRRLIQPEEIADAVCFAISNSSITGPIWADAGWHARP
jgi:NAD(P)-dependent dehydrogenase (short-subunit alcohol dehydrogenase family)